MKMTAEEDETRRKTNLASHADSHLWMKGGGRCTRVDAAQHEAGIAVVFAKSM